MVHAAIFRGIQETVDMDERNANLLSLFVYQLHYYTTIILFLSCTIYMLAYIPTKGARLVNLKGCPAISYVLPTCIA